MGMSTKQYHKTTLLHLYEAKQKRKTQFLNQFHRIFASGSKTLLQHFIDLLIFFNVQYMKKIRLPVTP